MRIRVLAVFSFFVVPCLTMAQSPNATVTGRVLDPSNAIVVGAKVEVFNSETGVTHSTETNGEGIYTVPGLSPGIYRMEVSKPGFKVLVKPDLVLHVQDVVAINFNLPLGSVAETVTVSAGGLVMNTTDASVSTVIDHNFVANIPLNGRSFQDLISLTPGVVTQSPQTYGAVGYSGDFSVNGQRTESNYYIVDGVSQNASPGSGGGATNAGTGGNLSATTALGTTQSLVSVDALQEFRVESSTYSAEYGRSPGGQFSMVSRSGNNNIHGTAFDYLRNNYFDANDWFNDHYGVPISALRQNDFGGTLGGPVWFPKLYNGRNRTFFFLSYEGLRLTQPQAASVQYVPDNFLRAQAPVLLQPILNAYPIQNGHDYGSAANPSLAEFIKSYSLPSHIDSISFRLDHTIGPTHIFVRAAYTPSSAGNRILSSAGVIAANLQSYTVGADTQISSVLSNELRIGYTRAVAKSTLALDNFGGATPIDLAQALGIGGYPRADGGIYMIFSGVGLSYLPITNTANYGRQWNLRDTISWSLGHHLLKAGADYRRITSPLAPNDPAAVFEFLSAGSVLTNNADAAGITRVLASTPVYNQLSLFGQDEWRVTRTLNISAGLRWEIDPPPTSNNANQPYPLLGNPNDPSTLSLGGKGAPLFKTTWNNFAPRLGAAWRAHGSPGAETVVRGGVGIFFDTGTSASSLVFSSVGTLAGTLFFGVPIPATPTQLNNLPTVSKPYGDVFAYSPTFKLPYTIEWNAALEQGLGKQQNITVSYVAASGRRLAEEHSFNFSSVNPDFTYVTVFDNGSPSNYQSLQVQFQRQMSHGLQALGSYTWSHALDYGSSNSSTAYKRGNADFDLRNNLSAALSYELPMHLRAPLARALLNNWALDGRVSIRSAFPVEITGNSYYDPASNALVNSEVDLVPGMPIYIYSHDFPGGRSINPAAFVSAPPDTQGNAPRNFARGFGASQINLAVRREFPLRETLRLQFRAEAFNIVNHPNFGLVDSTLTDAQFGQATQSLNQSLGTVAPQYQQGGARSLQFALKLLF